MTRVVVAVIILIGASAISAAAQEPAQRIEASLARAAAAGIPVSLLESKIAEGRAKNVPAPVIAAAIERRETALLRARDAMNRAPSVSAMDLGVAADALEAGIDAGIIGRLAEEAPSNHRAVAIAALTELVAAGTPVGHALQQVQDALRRGPEAISNLPAQSRGRGHGPPAEPGSRGRGAGAGPPEGTPRGPPAGVPPGGQGRGRGPPGGDGPPGQGGDGPPGRGGDGPPGRGGDGPPGQRGRG